MGEPGYQYYIPKPSRRGQVIAEGSVTFFVVVLLLFLFFFWFLQAPFFYGKMLEVLNKYTK